jgi:hypothetical protein
MRAALLLLALLLAGCADPSQAPTGPTWIATPLNGTPVLLPSWTVMRGDALAEIDAAMIPAGWRVVVTVPIFETAASPTGLARGLCDYTTRTLTVGWRARPWEDRPLLPALLHERDHILYGPCYGHPPGDCR